MRGTKLVIAATAVMTALGTTAAPSSAQVPGADLSVRGPRAGVTGVVEISGHGLGGATVSAFVTPSAESLDRAGATGLRLLPLGQTVTDGDGRFAVVRPAGTLPPGYVGRQGQVDLLVEIGNGSRSLTWTHTITRSDLSSGRGPALHVDLSTGAVADEQSSSGLAEVRATGVALAPYARTYLAASQTSRTAMLAQPTAGSAGPLAPASASAGGCGFTYWLNSFKTNVREHFIDIYSFSGALVTLTEGSSGSSSHTLGVVAQSSGGSLSLGGTVTKTWGVEVSQSGIADASVSNRINYRQRFVTCIPGSTWQPYSVYDFITDLTYAPHINYPNCAQRLAGTTWTTTSAHNVTYPAGVTFPGINVSAESGYGSSQQLTYAFTRTGYVCGNSPQGPTVSSLLSARG